MGGGRGVTTETLASLRSALPRCPSSPWSETPGCLCRWEQNERWTGRKALRGEMARAICKHFGPESGLSAILAHELTK